MNFEGLFGYEKIKNELNVLIDVFNNIDKYKSKNVTLPKGIMFSGAPGLGKTSFALAFLDAMNNRQKLIIRKSMPDGEFINYLKKSISELVEQGPCIVLFDDMDKYANEHHYNSNCEEYVTVQTIIDETKDKDVFFIGTVNEIDLLPESLFRPGRFSKVYEFSAPKLDEATLIVEKVLKETNIDSDMDYREIAKLLDGESCAKLFGIINEAAINAVYNNKEKVEREDIINAIVNNIYNDASKSLSSEYARNIAAVHEAGHAFISEYFERGSVNLISINNYADNVGGITSSSKPDNYWYDVELMKNQVRILLAGKAATELFLNINDTGSKSDINRAFKIVNRLVNEYCPNSFREYIDSLSYSSDELKCKYEISIRQELDRYYSEVKKILWDNRDTFNKLVDLLKQKMLVTQKEIKCIFA